METAMRTQTAENSTPTQNDLTQTLLATLENPTQTLVPLGQGSLPGAITSMWSENAANSDPGYVDSQSCNVSSTSLTEGCVACG